MPTAKPKVFNLKSFVINTLRRASYRHPARNEALTAARITRGVYRCAHCNGEFPKKEITLDHKIPVVDPVTGFTTWDDYVNRMFCDASNYQTLCTTCDDSKCATEREVRKKFRQQRKKD